MTIIVNQVTTIKYLFIKGAILNTLVSRMQIIADVPDVELCGTDVINYFFKKIILKNNFKYAHVDFYTFAGAAILQFCICCS